MQVQPSQMYSKAQFEKVHDPQNHVFKKGNITYMYPRNVQRNLKSEAFYETIVDELTAHYKKTHIDIDIILYFGKCKKRATVKSHYRFDLGNANSGFTLHTFDKTYIVVHREEDCMKVLIHELLHAFDMNIGYATTPIICNTQEFQVLLNEAYVESLALFWYCGFYARFNSISFRKVLAECKKFRRELAQKVASMIFKEQASHTSSNALCYYVFATQAFVKLKPHHLHGISYSDFKMMLSKRQSLWKGSLPDVQSLAAIPPV
jgi:hypothetical protein